jgi:hypothetical protein
LRPPAQRDPCRRTRGGCAREIEGVAAILGEEGQARAKRCGDEGLTGTADGVAAERYLHCGRRRRGRGHVTVRACIAEHDWNLRVAGRRDSGGVASQGQYRRLLRCGPARAGYKRRPFSAEMNLQFGDEGPSPGDGRRRDDGSGRTGDPSQNVHRGRYFRRTRWLTSKGSGSRRFKGRAGQMLMEDPRQTGSSRGDRDMPTSPLHQASSGRARNRADGAGRRFQRPVRCRESLCHRSSRKTGSR